MEGKKIIYFYKEWWDFLEDFTIEQRGEWITYIMQYINDMNPELPKDKQVMSTCKLVRNQLKRDLEEWKKTIEKRSEAGKKGMASRWGNNITNDNNVITPYNTDITADNDKDKVKDKDKDIHTNACAQEDQAETQKLIQDLEQLLGRVLTIVETETIITLNKRYSRIQIYNEVKANMDKQKPINYIKAKLEGLKTFEAPEQTMVRKSKYLETLKQEAAKDEFVEEADTPGTWLYYFNRSTDENLTPEERIEAAKGLHPYNPTEWYDHLNADPVIKR